MREFNTDFTPALQYGLRREVEAPRNSMHLTLCSNMIPRDGLLVGAGGISQIDPTAIIDWPYPQYIKGLETSFLLYATTLYDITSTPTELDIYDLTGIPYTLQSSLSQWHLADFGKTWLLFRPDCVVMKLNDRGMFGESQIIYAQDDIVMETGLAFKGRLIVGGFNPAAFWPVDWNSMLEYWTDQLPYQISSSLIMNQNFVMWSQIGGGDIAEMFMPSYGVTGTIVEDGRSLTDMMFMEKIRRNEWGFMPMPFQGKPLCLRELGNSVAVYGEDGIAIMFPVMEPSPTFGCRSLLNIGVAGRSAVSPDGKVFLATDGNLWKITEDYKAQRLGYQEFFTGFSYPVISQDISLGETYIADEDICYILTDKGLGETYQSPTSLSSEAELYGVVLEQADKSSILATDIMDFGVRDLKTITLVELDISTTENVYMRIDCRYAKDAAFQSTPWTLVNPEGFVRLQVSALEFRIFIMVNDCTDVELSSCQVRWQLNGKRTVRGIYGSTANE